MIYYTKQNEVLDYICWKHYFKSSVLESILSGETDYYDPGQQITGIFDIDMFVDKTDESLGKIVNKVIEANPHLVPHGIFLPSGLPVTLPDMDDGIDTTEEIVQLWD